MLPYRVQKLKDNFLYVAGPEVAGLEEPKKTVLLNCFLNKVTLGSVYPPVIEESVKGMQKLIKINGLDYDLSSKKS